MNGFLGLIGFYTGFLDELQKNFISNSQFGHGMGKIFVKKSTLLVPHNIVHHELGLQEPLPMTANKQQLFFLLKTFC